MARGTWGGATDPNIFAVRILFMMGTSLCQTGFKLRDVGVQDNTAQEVADEVSTQLLAGFRGLLKETDSVRGIDVLKMGTDEGGWTPAPVGTGTYTTSAIASMPDFTAVNVSLKSEIRKRYGQGRMFLPMVNEENVNGNVLAASGVTRIQTFIDLITAHFTGDPVTHDLLLVNAHPLLPARPSTSSVVGRPEIPASWYDVVSLRINQVVTSLRSRKAGVGS